MYTIDMIETLSVLQHSLWCIILTVDWITMMQPP